MEEKFRKIQERTVVLFAVLFLAVSFFLVLLMSGQSDYALRQTASNLIEAHNRKMQLNVDSYLTKIEKAASLMFAQKEYYEFDPSDDSDPYTKQLIEEAMTDRINDLGILDNYTDFAVVYEDDEMLGSVSKLTRGMYVNSSMYEDFSRILAGRKENRAWVFGLNDNTDHLYYLQRYNDRAIILVSFYTQELESNFMLPTQLTGMNVALVDDDNDVLYANDKEIIGHKMTDTAIQTIGDVTSGSVMTRDVLITSNTCINGWRIICSMPTDDIVRDNRHAMRRSMQYLTAVVLLMLVFGIRRAKAMNLSAAGIVETLQEQAQRDQMTGLFNKTNFEQTANRKLEHKNLRRTYCFTIIDVDHFKEINDRYGHSTGDAVLKQFAALLTENFGQEIYLLGRLGGDEFGVLAELEGADRLEAKAVMRSKLTQLREKSGNVAGVVVSFSSGTVQASETEIDPFAKLYERADKLLYQGKDSGRGCDVMEDDREEEI